MIARATIAPRSRVLARASIASTSPEPMPFTAIVNHAHVKAALLCSAVDPSASCIVSGRRGTAKSVLCRSVQTIMPRITGEDGVARAPRFVVVPLGVSEDRITGTIDIDASVRDGAPVFSPGILANAHEGVLYIDEINLLDDAALALIQVLVQTF